MNMKRYVVAVIICPFVFVGLLIAATPVEATTRVRGYWKPRTGTYVMPHYRSNPNKSTFDNWSTKGNFNPYTGKRGTRDPFRSSFKWRW